MIGKVLGKVKGVVSRVRGRGSVDGKGSGGDVGSGGESGRDVVGYVLYKVDGRKYKEIMRFDDLPDEEELLVSGIIGEPGRYVIRELRRDGKVGKTVWSRKYAYADEVDYDGDVDIGDVDVSKVRRGRGSGSGRGSGGGMGNLDEFIEQLEYLAEVADKYERVFKRLSGKVDLEDALETIAAFKEKFDKVADVLGYKGNNGGLSNVPVEGAVPAWLVAVPDVMDRVLDRMEGRVKKLVGLDDSGDGGDVGKVKEFPR